MAQLGAKLLLVMSEFDPNTLAGRIEQRLDALNKSAAAASEEATGKKDAIRKIYDKARKGVAFHPRMDTLQGLSRALHTTVAWLTEGDGPQEVAPGEVVLTGPTIERTLGPQPAFAGRVQAGRFLATDDYFNQDIEDVPEFVLPVPKYGKVRQYTWRARGDSMNEAGIVDGMWIVGADAADYIDTYGDIESGDLVVVERSRHQGAERELTVKQVHFFRDRYELRPASSNPEHQPIVVKHDHEVDADGVEVRIIGVVLTAYANLHRRT